MTYRVIFTAEAETDLRTAYRYIRSQAPGAALDWTRRARKSANSLARRRSVVLWLLRALPLTNPSANCFSARAIGALIASSSLCSSAQFTYCTFGMDPCSRYHRRTTKTEAFSTGVRGRGRPSHKTITAVYSHASSPDSYLSWFPASLKPVSISCAFLSAESPRPRIRARPRYKDWQSDRGILRSCFAGPVRGRTRLPVHAYKRCPPRPPVP